LVGLHKIVVEKVFPTFTIQSFMAGDRLILNKKMANDQESKEVSWRRIHTRMGQECSRVGEQAVYIGAAKKGVFSVMESAPEWGHD
jgi:hypothetical protein